jgi:hypothetical protein
VHDLQELAGGLLDELELVVLRQVKIGVSSGVRAPSGEARLPFDAAASELAAVAAGTIRSWTAIFKASNAHLITPRVAGVGDYAAWMARFPGLIASLKHAAQMADEIQWLTREVVRTIDLAPARSYLGQCSARTEDGEQCAEDVYAVDGREFVTCRACGTEHHVATRRRVLLDALPDQRLTVRQLAHGLPEFLGISVSENSLRTWIRKRQLAAVGRDDQGRAVFRVADVLELLVTKRTRRRGKVAVVEIVA